MHLRHGSPFAGCVRYRDLNLYFSSGEEKVRGCEYQKATIFHELFMNEASYKNVTSDTRSSILISVFIKDSCWAPAAHVITFAGLHSRDIELQGKRRRKLARHCSYFSIFDFKPIKRSFRAERR